MKTIGTLVSFLAAFVLLASAAGAGEVDWDEIYSERLALFYPGVTSWEFLVGPDHRLGSRDVRMQRKDCKHCHLSKAGKLDLKAGEIAAGTIRMKVSHKPFEPEPVPGKPGFFSAYMKAAYDEENVYVRIEWGSSAVAWRAPASREVAPDMVSVQINKTKESFQKYGCFITCHNDLYSMPGSPSENEVSNTPYYSSLGRSDVRLYAVYAREGWKDSSPKNMDDDGLIDLWSMQFAHGKVEIKDGWVYADRMWQDSSALEGTGKFEGGKYVAVFKRKLATGSGHDVSIREGDVVNLNVSIHDAGATRRKHYVSFPIAVGIGTGGDIKAVKLGE